MPNFCIEFSTQIQEKKSYYTIEISSYSYCPTLSRLYLQDKDYIISSHHV